MSEWNQPDYDDDDLDGNEPDGKKPNPVRDRLRKLEKENKDLKDQHAKATKELRQNNIANALANKVKDPAKVAKLIPADVDASVEAIEKWLADYADVFAVVTTEGDPSPEGESAEPDPEALAQQQAMSRIGKASGAGSTPTKQADLQARLADPKLTREELVKMIEQAGGGVGTG
jgi:hypothetical protein